MRRPITSTLALAVIAAFLGGVLAGRVCDGTARAGPEQLALETFRAAFEIT